MTRPRIAHLTSVHPRFDARIFLKECRSLSAAGYDVYLVVADGQGNATRDGVSIVDAGSSGGRLSRMTSTVRRVLRHAIELDASIYHLHDPELLSIAGALGRAGKKVVFDAHEDVSLQILTKHYLWRAARASIAWGYRRLETHVCARLAAVVTSTPFIRDKFRRINDRVVDINNYPIIGELASDAVDWSRKRPQVCYIGSIGINRGIRELVQSLVYLKSDAELVLCGKFEDERVREELESHAGWRKVRFLGWQDREQIAEVLAESLGGLVTLHATPRYVDAHPVKMFEYMSASVPVISSNFPLWRDIVEGNGCGVCVDPTEPREIAAAIDALVMNAVRARSMGENGARAIRDRYNWQQEEKKLVELYSRLM
jgi:glycosyltransferase involved in cell wall biosynthesis